MVMAYIIFLNGIIIAEPPSKLNPAVAVATGTALHRRVMTIAMGVFGNYPFGLAAGLGINAIVAFSLSREGASMPPARWASSSSRAWSSRSSS